MDLQQKTKRFGSILLLFSVVIRLCVPGTLQSIAAALSRDDNMAFLIYLETGQDVRPFFASGDDTVPSVESTAPAPSGPPAVPAVPPDTQPVLTPEAPVPAPLQLPEVETLSIYYGTKVSPDLAALAEAPVDLSTVPGQPAVLIYSTHSTESFTPGAEPYTPSAQYRTLDKECNMLSVGAMLEEKLLARDIGVIRDTALHDSPSYNYAYSHARRAITTYVKENPFIRLVLDLHRDAVQTKTGQLRTAAPGREPPCAQIMLVVGTNQSGLSHDGWEENLSMALKLNRILEAISPGITRPLSLRAQRFNQDVSPGALLVEIGAAGNTRAEALEAVEILAQAIEELFHMYGQ